MTVIETIKRRRSIGKMTEQRPTHEQIEQILEAATHAPNHHLVQPWKFFVLAGTARNELGTLLAESLATQMQETTSQKAEAVLNNERKKRYALQLSLWSQQNIRNSQKLWRLKMSPPQQQQ